VQRIADFIAGMDGKAKRRLWQRHFDALPSGTIENWEDLLGILPDDAWNALKATTLGQVNQHDPIRAWPQVQDRFNEVRAFHYLQKIGCTEITFAPTSMAMRGPDLVARRGSSKIACEVKTVHLKNGSAHVIRKLASRLLDAKAQASIVAAEEAYIYLVANGVDMALMRAAIDVSTLAPCRIVVDCNDRIDTLN